MLRKTPLKAKKPWRPARKPMKKRATRIRPRSRTKKYARRERDTLRMLWTKQQACVGPMLHECQGPIEAHHAGRRGLGQKAHDSTVIPLCQAAHRHWHEGGAAFKGWTNYEKRAWADRVIGSMQVLYALHVVSALATHPTEVQGGGR